jgi:hypothetical protein
MDELQGLPKGLSADDVRLALAEIWKPIAGYPAYEVSSVGRVRRVTDARNSKKGRILSTRGLREGYPAVDLCRAGQKRTHFVHRLVASAFLGPAKPGQEVNHQNGIRVDPRLENLEYTTRSGNALHAYELGLQDARGEKNGQAKLSEAAVREIRALAIVPGRPSYAAIGRRYGVNRNTISRIVNRQRWPHVN